MEIGDGICIDQTVTILVTQRKVRLVFCYSLHCKAMNNISQ